VVWLPTTLAGLVALGLVYGIARYVPRLPQIPAPRPAHDRREAADRLAAWDAAAAEPVMPLCRSRIDGTGRSGSVVLLLHGYTNCPHQFHQLAYQLVEDGHVVLTPRLPLHGYADRMPASLGALSPRRLAAFLGEMLDIAHGLGERTSVLGFSFGGVLAGWAAQQRCDVHHALLASPSLGLTGVHQWLRQPFANLMPLLPDRLHWWDGRRQAAKLGPPHAYVVYSMRGVGVVLELGNGLLTAARRDKPAAAAVTVALNPHDSVVDNRAAVALIDAWQKSGADVTRYDFPAELALTHDYMDPLQPRQQVDKVYPLVRALVAGQTPVRQP
jgi:carboxylesterase